MSYNINSPATIVGTSLDPGNISLTNGTAGIHLICPSSIVSDKDLTLPANDSFIGAVLTASDAVGTTAWGSTVVSTYSFSAFSTAANVSGTSDVQLSGFSTTDPYYTGTGLNAATGAYTVPATGKYCISATINYATTTAITTQLGAGSSPAFTLRRTSPAVSDLVASNFPVLDVNVALLLTLRTILGRGSVTLSADLQLTSGDVIALFYIPNGLNLTLNLVTAPNPGVVWSVHSLF